MKWGVLSMGIALGVLFWSLDDLAEATGLSPGAGAQITLVGLGGAGGSATWSWLSVWVPPSGSFPRPRGGDFPPGRRRRVRSASRRRKRRGWDRKRRQIRLRSGTSKPKGGEQRASSSPPEQSGASPAKGAPVFPDASSQTPGLSVQPGTASLRPSSGSPMGAASQPPKPIPTKAWVAQEVRAVRLGDARLDRRLGILVQQFADHPTASIPEACGDWASTKAASRFFTNAKVTHQGILAGHRPACLTRIAEESFLVVVQDTTSLDFTHHPQTEDLGPLDHTPRRGFFVHTGLAVNAEGVPLGILDQKVWARDPQDVGKRHRRKHLPIEEKESYKWLQGLNASLVDLPAQVCVVTVADREADIFDFFLEAQHQKTHLLVRAAWNRNLADPPGTHLWEAVAQSSVQGHLTVEVRRAEDHPPRQATCVLRFTPVTVKPPRYRLKEPGLHPLRLYAVEVREETPPAGVSPLHWLLLTTVPVKSFDEAIRCVTWYQYRWLVERYHFVLKSGCRIEARQLEKRERLERCLGVYAIVAWRLLWLTYLARATPEAPCTVALETSEWQALYCYLHKTPIPPAEPPTLHQAVRWIAKLGGFLGRTHDGEPGVKVLWRGWRRLDTITETWLLFHPPPDVGKA